MTRYTVVALFAATAVFVLAPSPGHALFNSTQAATLHRSATRHATELNQLDRGYFRDTGDLLAPSAMSRARWCICGLDTASAQSRSMLASTQSPLVVAGPTTTSVPVVAGRERRALVKRIGSRLHAYDALFDRAARAHGVPASLLAAQAYMESKWEPQASHHGVAGMMMLSSSTARVVGVENRLRASQSINGGAAYLAKMRARISRSVPLPDRNFFALAAYNMGLAHVHDAQVLAAKLGKNPNVWSDVKQVMPLLAEKRYYRTLRYGYARGDAVVRYIERVRGYQAIISPHMQ